MNNNNRGNNRRRGRSNNNVSRPQGNGQQTNRIDSRARGNAPQLLEKYRKLAQDAHLNGDRVNAEYNLQFADHYFRVIADTRTRQEEARLRRDDRWQDNGEGSTEEVDDAGDFAVDADFPAFDQPPVYTRRDREDRPERQERAERQERPERDDRPDGNHDRHRPAEPVARIDADADGPASDNPPGAEAQTVYEPEQNPFVRENRGSRGLRPRREDRAPRRENRDDGRDDGRGDGGDGVPGESAAADEVPAVISGFDPASLPPAISAGRNSDETRSADDSPRPARRARRKPSGDDAGEALQSLS